MDEPYRAPDRAEIAARVRAQLAAERAGTFTVGPGSGWDPLARRELDELAGIMPADIPAAAPPPAARCGACGYVTTASGHAIQCGGDG